MEVKGDECFSSDDTVEPNRDVFVLLNITTFIRFVFKLQSVSDTVHADEHMKHWIIFKIHMNIS